MTITCSLCKLPFKSLIITPEIALNEITQKLAQHMKDKHHEEAKKMIDTIVQLTNMMPFILIMQHATWSAVDEPFVDEQYRGWSKRAAEAVGIVDPTKVI